MVWKRKGNARKHNKASRTRTGSNTAPLPKQSAQCEQAVLVRVLTSSEQSKEPSSPNQQTKDKQTTQHRSFPETLLPNGRLVRNSSPACGACWLVRVLLCVRKVQGTLHLLKQTTGFGPEGPGLATNPAMKEREMRAGANKPNPNKPNNRPTKQASKEALFQRWPCSRISVDPGRNRRSQLDATCCEDSIPTSAAAKVQAVRLPILPNSAV